MEQGQARTRVQRFAQWLFFFVLGTVVLGFIEYNTHIGESLAVGVFGWLVDWGQKPMGWFWLSIWFVLVAGIVIAAIDPVRHVRDWSLARSKRMKEAADAAALVAKEQYQKDLDVMRRQFTADLDAERRRLVETEEVNRILELYQTLEREAGDSLAQLSYRMATYTREQGHAGSELFARQSEALQTAHKAFNQSLDPIDYSLGTIQGRLRDYIAAYWDAAKFVDHNLKDIAGLESKLNDSNDSFHTLDYWRERHVAFAKMITTLKGRWEFQRGTPIGWLPSDTSDFGSVVRLPRPPLRREPRNGEQTSTVSAS